MILGKKGDVTLDVALGLAGCVLCIALMATLPTMNITILGLDFTSMESNLLWLYQLALFLLAFVSLFYAVLKRV